jgi:hypothetical protein
MSEQRYHAAVAEDRAETLWLVADVTPTLDDEPADWQGRRRGSN